MIGADSLGFLGAESLPELIGGNCSICDACFTGRYHTGTPDDGKDVFEH